LVDAVDPDWSPDGRWIAAAAWSGGALLLIDPGSGATSTPGGSPAGVLVPAWSPDGSRIAFIAGGDLYIATLGGASVRITTGLPVFPGRPAWSPDGGWLAFTVGEASTTDIFVVGSEGEGPWRLTTGAGAMHADWRPALP
jgi:Tol biopolymer transport system component